MGSIYNLVVNSDAVSALLGPDLFMVKLWASFVLASYLIFPKAKNGEDQ